MTRLLVDVHTHLAETRAVGHWVKETCDIWEYGPMPGVPWSAAGGDLRDLRTAIDTADLTYAVVVNCFSIGEWRGRRQAGLLDDLNMGVLPSGRPVGALASWLIGFNEWLVDSVRDVPRIMPFVASDPWLLSPEDTREHLTDMRRRGARGVKLHPVEQRIRFDDELLRPLFRICFDLDLAVLTHSGPARHEVPFAEPSTIAAAARDWRTHLVVAHLGGAAWRQAPALADSCPGAVFDLSEIVAWLGAPRAPSPDQLVDLIREIGVSRVLFGSDFPWYDPITMISIVDALPRLTDAEKDAVLGENAARLFGLRP